jgi:Carboxypeptidase regulatory-like domain
MSHVRRSSLAFFVALATALSAAAQQQLGAIQGTITDQTHAVLPTVTVTVTNLDTGVVRTVQTNEAGIYRVASLDPGLYKVEAALQGFKTAGQTDVRLSVGATLGINFTLNPGGVEEAIQVTGRSPDIQTEKAEVSSVVEQQKVVDLPLVGRNMCGTASP